MLHFSEEWTAKQRAAVRMIAVLVLAEIVLVTTTNDVRVFISWGLAWLTSVALIGFFEDESKRA